MLLVKVAVSSGTRDSVNAVDDDEGAAEAEPTKPVPPTMRSSTVAIQEGRGGARLRYL